ncbi:MAG: hypothetical protein D6689_23040 [Deltaproteobacteria bacterium]|nr:MAG: hypothetical protein D6689_23040 [Deltaproteobacteria bacterium]
MHAASARAHLRDPTMRLTGELRADGLATAAPIEGTLVLAPVARRRIRYAFTFAGDDGRRYRFEGEKRLRLRGLRRSLTELPGTIYDGDGARVGDVLVRFDLAADWRAFARSWRPA